VILFLWSKGSRFASPRYELVKIHRPFFEYIQAMGRWYERSLSKKELLDLLLSRLNEKIKSATGVSHGDGSEFYKAYQSLVSKVEEVKKSKVGISNATLFALCKQIERLEREIEQWKDRQTTWKRFKA
jgi:FtsZ-binding cell division protein ZapB